MLTLPAGRRAKWAFLVLWLAIVAVMGPYAGKLSSVETNDASAYLPASAQSTEANDVLGTFPGGKAVPGVAVYLAAGRVTAADRVTALGQRAAVARQVPDVKPGALSVSPDGRALEWTFSVDQPHTKKLTEDIQRVRAVVAGTPGLRAYTTGAAGLLVDSVNAFNGIDGILLLVTGLVVIALLLLIYRSPILWLVPILSVVGAIGLSEFIVYQLAKHSGLVVSGQSGGILTVLVFGAGTDYALLLTARYREELRRHDDRHAAMHAALTRAAPAILASASTVILGLLCLLISTLNSDSGLGPVGAIGIAAALLAQLTFLPALLVVGGRWLFWPARPSYGAEVDQQGSFWGRTGRAIARRPRRVWATATAGLAVLACGLFGLHLGLQQVDGFTTNPQSVVGQRVLASHFPAGGGAPTLVFAREQATAGVLRVVRSTPGVAFAEPVARAHGEVEVAAILGVSPDSAKAYAAVRSMRRDLAAVPGAHALVGGQTATDLDVNNAASTDRDRVMPLVLLVVMVILGLLLRAVVAPVILALTVVLSFAAALGVGSVVFDAVGFAGVDQTLPLLAFIFLVALGVDYNIFLMSRVREEALTRGTREGTVVGVAVTGGVITSAGVVLAATFSALAVLPLVTLVEIGFIVAFGVLLDTLVVRSVLVPALVCDVGPRMWWPSALGRGEPRTATPPERPSVRL